MSEIYCTLDEAYGSDFTKSLDTKKALSNTKIYNNKQPKTLNNNFEISNLELNKKDNKKDNNKSKNNNNFLENNYNSNHTLLMKLLNENVLLNEKLDLLLSRTKNNNLTDIIIYIISGILIILFIDMIIKRTNRLF